MITMLFCIISFVFGVYVGIQFSGNDPTDAVMTEDVTEDVEDDTTTSDV